MIYLQEDNFQASMMNIKISAAILSALMLAASCGNNSEPQEKPAKGDYPVLKQTTLGVYDYKGKTWKYEEGEDQISRYYKDGKVDFSILNPDKGAIVTVSGIPEDVSVNKSIVVNIKDNVTNVQTGMSVTVLRIKDGMAWLGANDGTGMIVKL